jgi:citronellol/citronellal dehydrogenase
MSYDSVFRSDLFQDHVAIVTGGGSGIGRCIAHELASLGATVIVSGRTLDKLKAVQAEIVEDGGRAEAIACNIRQEDEVAALYDQVLERHGRVDHVVNNAGGQFLAVPEAISLKGWNAVIETNLTGTFMMCQAAFKKWMRENGGNIVNIVADFWRGMPHMAHTSAARAGVANLTMSLSLSWCKNGVRINSVAPGIIESSGLKSYPLPVIEMLQGMKTEIPAKRLGTESEVSSIVMFLLSPGAAYLSGQTIAVDGGASLYRQMLGIPDHESMPAYEGFHRAADVPDLLSEE